VKLRFRPFQPKDAETDAMGVFVPALLLVGLGLICVFSFGSSHLFRQASWAVLGVVLAVAVSRVPLPLVRKAALPAVALTAILLLCALLFAPEVKGTRRWLMVPLLGRFQPSELAKLAVVLWLAHRLSSSERAAERPFRAAWPALLLCGMVLPAPDLGTTVFLASVVGMLLIVAGVRLGRFIVATSLALAVFAAVAWNVPYMRERLDHLRGEKNYQVVQAELAFGSGQLWGKGLGAGIQKYGYLPEGHTDFVLPNVGEEMGFFGIALISALFMLILVHGVRTAMAALPRDRFGFYLACGATFVVVFQAFLNFAVSTGAAPTKGISLPFLSQGGSNLLVSLAAIGLIVNVRRSLEATS
jgi:cell division protein FtsW